MPKSLCFILLLFAAHFLNGLGPLCARCSADRASHSSGLQLSAGVFAPGCSGQAQYKSHSGGELTLSACQLCSVRQLRSPVLHPKLCFAQRQFAQLIGKKKKQWADLKHEFKSNLDSRLKTAVLLALGFVHRLLLPLKCENRHKKHGKFGGTGCTAQQPARTIQRGWQGPCLLIPKSCLSGVPGTTEKSSSASNTSLW